MALLEWSDIEAARSELDSAVEHLREVLRLLPGLTASERLRTLTRIGQHYSSAGMEDVGTRLLDRARTESLAGLEMHDAAIVDAVAELARVLLRYERRADARAVLQPVVPAARKRFVSSTETPRDLQKAYFQQSPYWRPWANRMLQNPSAKKWSNGKNSGVRPCDSLRRVRGRFRSHAAESNRPIRKAQKTQERREPWFCWSKSGRMAELTASKSSGGSRTGSRGGPLRRFENGASSPQRSWVSRSSVLLRSR